MHHSNRVQPQVPPRFTLAVAALVIVVALAGCATSNEQPAELDIAALIAKTSPFQRDILKKGTVARADYEKAVLAQRECVIATGAEASELYETGNNELTFDFGTTTDTDEQNDAIMLKAGACLTEYRSEVGKVWAFQQLLSPQQRKNLRPEVIACLVSEGVTIKESATITEVYRAVNEEKNIQASRPCVSRFAAFFAVAPSRDDNH